MKQVSIGELCELKYGKSLRKDTRIPGGVPVYGSNGVVDYHEKSLITQDTIVVGRKGSIGETHLVKQPSWPIDTTYYVSLKTTYPVNLEWFYKLLKTLGLSKLNRSAAIPGLNRDDVYRIKINLPPLGDQIRIAHFLGKVEALIAQRKQHLQQLDELIKSVFLDMFGPSAPDFDIWPLVEIKDLAANHKGAMRTGPFGSNLLHSEFSEQGDVAVLGIDNAVKNRFSWDERRYITNEKYKELKNYTIFPGDVIVTIMGTIGRSAVIPDDIPLAINTKHLAAITLNRKIANPVFISYSIHSSPYIIEQFKSKNRGAIMSGLNLGIIKEIKLRRPPIELQNKFEEIHNQIEKNRNGYMSNLSLLESLYGALSQKAFKGELDLSRIPLPELPENRPEENLPSATADIEPVLNLSSLDEYPMDSVEGRERLLQQWFMGFLSEQSTPSYSLEAFWREAQLNSVDYSSGESLNGEETVSGFTSDDYDRLRNWIFEQVRSGKLEQAYNEDANTIQLKAQGE